MKDKEKERHEEKRQRRGAQRKLGGERARPEMRRVSDMLVQCPAG
jgi:hypothetical protein